MVAKSKIVLILLSIIFLLVNLSCVPVHQGGAELKFKMPKVLESEYSEYIVYDAGQKKRVGQAKFYLKEKEKEGKKIIDWKAEFSYPQKKIKAKAILASFSFIPMSSFKEIKVTKERYQIETKYLPRRAMILLKTRKKSTKLNLEVPSHIYDNDSLLFVLRFLDFANYIKPHDVVNEKKVICSVLISEIGQTSPVNLKISEVKVDWEIVGKKFTSCYKVELKGTRKMDKQYAWYSTTSPYYLLKYKNKHQEFVLKKVEKL